MTNIIEQMLQFLDCYELAEARETVMDLFELAISSATTDEWPADKRADMIFFCRQLQRLLDCLYDLEPTFPQIQTLINNEA